MEERGRMRSEPLLTRVPASLGACASLLKSTLELGSEKAEQGQRNILERLVAIRPVVLLSADSVARSAANC